MTGRVGQVALIDTTRLSKPLWSTLRADMPASIHRQNYVYSPLVNVI